MKSNNNDFYISICVFFFKEFVSHRNKICQSDQECRNPLEQCVCEHLHGCLGTLQPDDKLILYTNKGIDSDVAIEGKRNDGNAKITLLEVSHNPMEIPLQRALQGKFYQIKSEQWIVDFFLNKISNDRDRKDSNDSDIDALASEIVKMVNKKEIGKHTMVERYRFRIMQKIFTFIGTKFVFQESFKAYAKDDDDIGKLKKLLGNKLGEMRIKVHRSKAKPSSCQKIEDKDLEELAKNLKESMDSLSDGTLIDKYLGRLKSKVFRKEKDLYTFSTLFIEEQFSEIDDSDLIQLRALIANQIEISEDVIIETNFKEFLNINSDDFATTDDVEDFLKRFYLATSQPSLDDLDDRYPYLQVVDEHKPQKGGCKKRKWLSSQDLKQHVIESQADFIEHLLQENMSLKEYVHKLESKIEEMKAKK